jgi:vacuolar-type H+-ATPase subunit F/Vma7
MAAILALGSQVFVRRMELGGAAGRAVDAGSVAAALESAIAGKEVGLVLLEAPLVAALAPDVYERVFSCRNPVVVAVGGRMNEVLRRRIREVVGADLLSTGRVQ